MKTTCYKCGREIEGTRAIGVWPICPECESLEVLKDINSRNGSDKCCGHSHGGGGGGWIDNQKVEEFLKAMMWQKIQYDYMPKWSTVVMDDERRFNTGLFCLFLGSFGAHLFYMKRWVPMGVFLVFLAIISGGLSAFLLFPFFAVFSIVYFSMDDSTFRKKCIPKQFKDYFKAQLCLYNLAKYGQKIPDSPPMTFANCIMSKNEIRNCRPVLSNFMANDYFKKEMQFFKDFEDNNHVSYQEGFLRKTMADFPELTEECEHAIRKIHMTGSFVEDWGDRLDY